MYACPISDKLYTYVYIYIYVYIKGDPAQICTPYVYTYVYAHIDIHIRDSSCANVHIVSISSKWHTVQSATKDGKWLGPCSAGLDKMCRGPRTGCSAFLHCRAPKVIL